MKKVLKITGIVFDCLIVLGYIARMVTRPMYENSFAAQVARAKGAIQEVKSYIAETVLTATADGTVTEIFPEIGELVGTGAPIMNVAMDTDVRFIFNIREDYLPEMKVGSNLSVYIPALDKDIEVKISRIAVMGSYSTFRKIWILFLLSTHE